MLLLLPTIESGAHATARVGHCIGKRHAIAMTALLPVRGRVKNPLLFSQLW